MSLGQKNFEDPFTPSAYLRIENVYYHQTLYCSCSISCSLNFLLNPISSSQCEFLRGVLPANCDAFFLSGGNASSCTFSSQAARSRPAPSHSLKTPASADGCWCRWAVVYFSSSNDPRADGRWSDSSNCELLALTMPLFVKFLRSSAGCAILILRAVRS
jgi:hypothetical protein